MGNSTWIVVILIVILCVRKRQRTAAVMRVVRNRRKRTEEKQAMKELAKQFIGKECMIYTVASFDGSIQGTIREVGDGGMLIEKNSGEMELINLDFVTRIREYPRKKNGKKKSVVLD